MNIRHILVPVDFSEGTPHAVEYAVDIGIKFSSRITLFHVIQPITPPPESLILAFDPYDQALAEEASKKLRELSAGVSLDLEVDTDLISGVPWASIVGRAQSSAIDLIVMPTHGRTALKHLWLGSVAERVVRHAPCPVLVVRQHQPQAADQEGRK